MNQSTSYLKQLKFDPKLKQSFVAKYLSNVRLVLLVMFLIIAVGTVSFLSLPKLLNPDINIPLVIISDVLPGAGPKDVESLVTIPIEDAVSGLPNVKTVTSSSQDSVSVTQMEFESGVDPDKARTDVQSAVDSVTLPKDAQAAKVQKLDFQNAPVWTFTITGHNDTASLNRFAKSLQQRLKDLSSIDNVTVNGLDDQEIQILVRPEAVATYHINPMQISGAITAGLGSYPAGSISTNTNTYSVTIDPSITTVQDVRQIMIPVNGTTMRLSEIADISERSKPNQNPSYFATRNANPEHSVTVNIFKTHAVNINTAVGDAEKVVNESIQNQNNEFSMKSIINTSELVDKQFSELLRDFWITITLVVLALFVFLGIRQAFVAAFSAPLTFLITFIVMNLTGLSLNFISFFALLLTLGLLVDDTIVVISAMTAYQRTGKFSSLETGLLVWRDFIVAIFTTTITTVWAFLPLLLASGIIGEFIKPIPIVVSTTLIASFFIAMLVTLPVIIILLNATIARRVVILLKILSIIVLLGIYLAIIPKGPLFIFEILGMIFFLFITQTVRHIMVQRTKAYVETKRKKSTLLKNGPKYFEHGLIHFDLIANKYRRLITNILLSQRARKRTVAMVVIFSLFSYLLVPFGFVKNEFFPNADQDQLYISVELPAGTNVRTADQEARLLMNQLKNTEQLDFMSADIGQAFSDTGGTAGSGSNNVLITLSLIPHEKRHVTSITIAQHLREQFAGYQKGKLSVVEASSGPPAGSDLQIKLFGDDLTVVSRYADKMQAYLGTLPGVTNIDKTVKSGTSKLTFVPNQERLAATGITQDQLGLWLRIFASGFAGNTIKLAEDSSTAKDITLRMNGAAETPEALSSVIIPTPTGNASLGELGTFSLEPNPTLITREDGKRTISVTAGVTQGYNISDLNKKLESYAESGLGLPSGYSWKTGGVNEENQSSVTSILEAMLLSFFLIIVTMVVQFSSFRKALIVMLVIPLSVSGVFIIFALTRTPLSFPALIGVLALFGIVVKNSILVVDKIKQNIEAGLPFIDAIVDGSSSRLEAIALTSFCAILGLIPITLSDPLWRGLGGAIIAGLTFSGTIMLFFIPVVYYYWFHPGNIKSKK